MIISSYRKLHLYVQDRRGKTLNRLSEDAFPFENNSEDLLELVNEYFAIMHPLVRFNYWMIIILHIQQNTIADRNDHLEHQQTDSDEDVL